MHVLVAGPIAAGKTTFSDLLALRIGATRVSVRELLHEALGTHDLDRADLQVRGADLDRRTMGRWLLHRVQERGDVSGDLVVDSLRTRRQTLPLLNELSSCALVYLDAHDATRRRRYSQARVSDPVKATVSFDTAVNHPTEQRVVDLKPLAHLVLATDDSEASEVVDEVVSRLGL